MDINIFLYITITLISIVIFLEITNHLKLIIKQLSSINTSIKEIEFQIKKGE